MLNARIYRAALVPLALAVVVCAFSLGGKPGPVSSTLAPDAFEGPRAYADMQALAAAFPRRRPGSAGDAALAGHVAAQLEGLGGPAGGGFTVQTQRFEGETIDGTRTLTTVTASRAGSTEASPIVIVANRDSAAAGASAELSGTGVLLELARVLAARATKRTVVLVSTSGGSGGDAGAAHLLAGGLRVPPDAAIVLGDLASAHLRTPLVVPYSDGVGSAPLQLQRTVQDAITRYGGLKPGSPSGLGQLAHLAFPFATGDQGVLQRGGIPAVLVQASGERGPSAGEPISPERIEQLGRSVLGAVDALDASPDIARGPTSDLVVLGRTLPEWAVALLAFALLLAPGVAAIDGLARARRRRLGVGRATLWTLSCALPFLACALFAYVLGLLGIVAAPGVPVPPASAPLDGSAAAVLAGLAVTFALSWALWLRLMRRLGWETRPDAQVAGLAVVAVLVGVAGVVWLIDPFTALLLAPAANLFLIFTAAQLRPGRAASLLVVAVALLPLVLLVAFYARQLGLGPGGVAWTSVLVLAGGHVGVGGALLWSLALGCAVTATRLALDAPEHPPAGPSMPERITIRGPHSYAGPGSLGGTESALRR
jgi:hypothetical protein